MNDLRHRRVHAVVVTYLPALEPLAALLDALSRQVEGIHVIDNTSAADDRVPRILAGHSGTNVVLHRLGSNLGIAKALNVGIERAALAGASHVLLSDQDSLPAADMVEELLAALDGAVAEGRRIGAVGPAYVDEVTGQMIPFQVAVPGRCFYRSFPVDPEGPSVDVLTTISSGTLIPIEAIRGVGGMCEALFIDHVDTEWCHRARAAGYAILGAPRARLSHRLGDDAFRVWSFGWRPYTDYSPLRLYYRFRNFVLLWRMSHVDLCWKVRASWYWLGDLYAHVVFSRKRFVKLAMILKGIVHGIMGRAGKYKE